MSTAWSRCPMSDADISDGGAATIPTADRSPRPSSPLPTRAPAVPVREDWAARDRGQGAVPPRECHVAPSVAELPALATGLRIAAQGSSLLRNRRGHHPP